MRALQYVEGQWAEPGDAACRLRGAVAATVVADAGFTSEREAQHVMNLLTNLVWSPSLTSMGTSGIQVNVQEAKTRLSELLARAERGEDIVIARAGIPVVRFQLVDGAPPRTFGVMQLDIPDDFDEPLPDDELAAWE